MLVLEIPCFDLFVIHSQLYMGASLFLGMLLGKHAIVTDFCNTMMSFDFGVGVSDGGLAQRTKLRASGGSGVRLQGLRSLRFSRSSYRRFVNARDRLCCVEMVGG